MLGNEFTDVASSMSKWPEKIKISLSSFYKASELSKSSQMCSRLSEKKAIFENAFDHSGAKRNLKHKLLNFSGHLHTVLVTLGKKK